MVICKCKEEEVMKMMVEIYKYKEKVILKMAVEETYKCK